jgi:proteasome alpha subunit
MEGKEGYDSSNTMYSPDGRMYQVEYARQAINRGTITCGIVYKDGVLLLVEKKIRSKLLEPDSIEKIFKIDKNIGCSMSGLVADARVLIDDVRAMSQDERYFYGEMISILELVKDLSSIVWHHSADGGSRPLGIGLLIGGFDRTGAHLFSTDPSGAYQEIYAGAIGSNSQAVEEYLENKYKENMNFKNGLNLLVSAINNVEEDKTRHLELGRITKDNGFERFSNEDLEKLLK